MAAKLPEVHLCITKLCHKCDHSACVSVDGGHFEQWWSRFIWHNFVKVADKWIKIGTRNRCVKYGLKIPPQKNVRRSHGGFFWLTLYVSRSEPEQHRHHRTAGVWRFGWAVTRWLRSATLLYTIHTADADATQLSSCVGFGRIIENWTCWEFIQSRWLHNWKLGRVGRHAARHNLTRLNMFSPPSQKSLHKHLGLPFCWNVERVQPENIVVTQFTSVLLVLVS